ncbi:MAG: tetratricopeptide repeat protein [Bernardetiaceae bacterium]|jgi:predicted Zn-dependent protease|nr:tetratricopeptide repeat protein [Bernardetiaceae bacterium]
MATPIPPRLGQLLALLAEEPDDPFLLYALATEYRAEQPERSLALYEQLLTQHPGYVATYYHAAALYRELGQPQMARQVYQTGLAQTQTPAHRHAHGELQRAYREFLDELEEL